MRRDFMKLLILAGVLGFAVLYGMELSAKGIKDVNGDLQQSNSTVSSDEWQLPSQTPDHTLDSAISDWDQELYGVPQNNRKPIVDRVSGAAGDTLHELSRGGIKFVVSLFERVMG
ncbi:MAG: hypothetical protein P0Y55_10795 [Candidatus Cohnella colombiensis]|uniref:DUF3679 domain-containing protein n=1 Tax=Candidatus Cohnella colombiensis TaxID=3121368 RepID=A0AA95ETS1_9BACL|nr:MAG: hypothetical protein P0Y55_10795 [Cohnella sp.]